MHTETVHAIQHAIDAAVLAGHEYLKRFVHLRKGGANVFVGAYILHKAAFEHFAKIAEGTFQHQQVWAVRALQGLEHPLGMRSIRSP